MIVSNLKNSSRIESLHPLFRTLFEYVKSHDLLHADLGRIDIAGDDLAELVSPLIALRLIGSDKGIHGKQVHTVIMGQGGFLIHTILDPLVVDDVISADKSCKAEGL